MINKIKKTDPEVYKLVVGEQKRQQDVLEMIPSENYASAAVMEAMGSVLGNKYAEGYPKKRYYQGNEFIDQLEQLTIDRAKKLFGVPHVNVQPYSGSPANAAVMFALLNPGDKIMGLALDAGGHLTHGHPKITFSGKYFNSVQYTVEKDGIIDYDKLAKQVLAEKPKMLICGTTAYPRALDFAKFSKMADSVGAILLADVSHIAGLIVGGAHQSPVPYAHVIMATTHKTLRGPRGAILLVTDKGLKMDPEMGDKIDQAVFPGLQGGPHLNTIGGMAISFKEATSSGFKKYIAQVVENNQVLAKELMAKGLNLVTGGTDNHLLVIDFQERKLMGRVVAQALEWAGIVANKNTVPGDPLPPFFGSGVRMGTPAITTRGMKAREMKKIAAWVAQVVELVKPYSGTEVFESKEARTAYYRTELERVKKSPELKKIAKEVKLLCQNFPI